MDILRSSFLYWTICEKILAHHRTQMLSPHASAKSLLPAPRPTSLFFFLPHGQQRITASSLLPPTAHFTKPYCLVFLWSIITLFPPIFLFFIWEKDAWNHRSPKKSHEKIRGSFDPGENQSQHISAPDSTRLVSVYFVGGGLISRLPVLCARLTILWGKHFLNTHRVKFFHAKYNKIKSLEPFHN